MFEQSMALGTGRTNKTWTVLVSFAGQLAGIGVAIVMPLMFTDSLPKAQLTSFLVEPPPPPPPPPPARGMLRPARRVTRTFNPGRLMEPRAIPDRIAIVVDEAPPMPAAASDGAGVPGGLGVPGGQHNGVIDGVVRGVLESAAPPAPAPAAKPDPAPPAPKRIVVGGNVQKGKLIHGPIPVYPELARRARISGVVRLQGIISREGVIQRLEVISGHPLLVPAALEAVKQWRYSPTVLNGEPVEVIAPIEVIFTLG